MLKPFLDKLDFSFTVTLKQKCHLIQVKRLLMGLVFYGLISSLFASLLISILGFSWIPLTCIAAPLIVLYIYSELAEQVNPWALAYLTGPSEEPPSSK